HLSPDGDYDLIHCAHCLSKNKNRPWVADIEMTPSFAISGWDTKKGKEKIEKILMSKNCKKLIPWAESIKRDVLKAFPNIEDKVEVVYPAVPEIKKLKKSKNKKLKIIFIARYFDIKGGLIALEVMERLRQRHNIEGIVVSSVSEELKEKYNKLKIYDLLPQQKLFELMKNSDLFLYPGSVDTFGFSLLEAMSFGLPTITINTERTASRKEIIENGETGLIFDIEDNLSFEKIGQDEEAVIKKLINRTSILIENNKLREKMSKNCLKEIRSGKFSIKERNKKLNKIYREAIK
ncbi:MAG: glycosyltransferase family 4 protein, partial [Candidatus Peregrinibacteria bacterium]|nr:glycosyltransferase family 4 protein [Candidatus Peregrinibacteria bacterium]